MSLIRAHSPRRHFAMLEPRSRNVSFKLRGQEEKAATGLVARRSLQVEHIAIGGNACQYLRGYLRWDLNRTGFEGDESAVFHSHCVTGSVPSSKTAANLQWRYELEVAEDRKPARIARDVRPMDARTTARQWRNT